MILTEKQIITFNCENMKTYKKDVRVIETDEKLDSALRVVRTFEPKRGYIVNKITIEKELFFI